MRNIKSLQHALDCIPSDDRVTWVKVLGALKHEALIGEMAEDAAYSMADAWSARSPKYDAQDFARVWHSLKDGVQSLATCGVIYEEAKKYGYTPKNDYSTTSRALAFGQSLKVEDTANAAPTTRLARKNQILTFLRALYKSDDKINIVTQCEERKDGKYTPMGIGTTMTVEEWEATIRGSFEQSETIFGLLSGGVDDNGARYSYNHKAGGWVRLNPLDGGGVADKNITAYRYALIESDSMDKAAQLDLLNRLNLPIKAIIDSGNKSIHAIVLVNAANASDYAIKVRFLYDFCKAHGLDVDYNDSNPSRLYRLPGLLRGESTQYCIKTYQTVQDFETWQASVTMGVPVDVCDGWDDFDPAKDLAPVLVEGVLRRGHKMLLGGPSKAGKSMALIELAAALSTGSKWLGYQCQKSKVLYLNLEIDPPSFINRVHKVFNALHMRPDQGMLDIWHLRGVNPDLNKLVETTISYATKRQWDAIIVDPIYKLRVGDENDATAIGTLCAAFDRLAAVMGASIIYAHHFAKGTAYTSAAKNVADRVSGSGVFGRDADAIITLLQLDYEDVTAPCKTAWRLDSCLREFAPLPPTNLFFAYPLHKMDDTGLLNDAAYCGDIKAKGGAMRGDQETEAKQDRLDALASYLHNALETPGGRCEMVNGRRAVKSTLVSSALDIPKQTLSRYMMDLPKYTYTKYGRFGYIILNDNY